MTRDKKKMKDDAVAETLADPAVNNDCHRKPAVDFDGAMLRLGGDRQLFLDFVHILGEDGPVLIQKIETAIESSDCQQLEHSAHALKGLVSNFGARDCVADALLLEQAGRAGELSDVEAPFKRLIENHQHLLCELETLVD
jgi:HPt (histidine-containing phosphotransfer) domain-containing protein